MRPMWKDDRFLWPLQGVVSSKMRALIVLFAALAAPPSPAETPVSFAKEIRPIIERKCVACHACFESPCQLRMDDPVGLLRGANKLPVYQGTRVDEASPTRLGVDAQDAAQWESLGFFSVLTDNHGSGGLLLSLLRLGREHPMAPNQPMPESIPFGLHRDDQCPTPEEYQDYVRDYPDRGMPLGAPSLTDQEFSLVSRWLSQGGEVGGPDFKPSRAQARLIADWERFLNQRDARSRLVARYLFEHLFLAHLYMDEITPLRFFRLVRSRSAPGQPVVPVATRRPNDDPEGAFWYRLVPVLESISYKKHITYRFDRRRLQHLQQLFFGEPWLVGQLPGYSAEDRANPLAVFSAIPAHARYRFLLDDALYFVRTFIRGPVCHGQIATDVIRDRFWTLFESPDTDAYVNDAAYRDAVTPLLGLPGQQHSLLELGSEWLKYSEKRNEYLRKRMEHHRKAHPNGPGLGEIWDGDGHRTDALLTVFRHHDNAAVRTGLVGALPQTLWVMDYPLLERSYYSLVTNFDVFGNLVHQGLTRLYFDLIRNGSEQNFLRFLPADQRTDILHDWYRGSGLLKLALSYEDIDTSLPSAVPPGDGDPRTNCVSRLVDRLDKRVTRVRPLVHGTDLALMERANALLQGLADRPAEALPLVEFLPELSFLRVHTDDGAQAVFSVVRDRAHSNVAFVLGESLRQETEKDRLTIFPDLLGSYPNFIFDVPDRELEAFVAMANAVKEEKALSKLVERWGVRRSNPAFWKRFHAFGDYLRSVDPKEAGIFDMGRYGNL